jgi:hyaluronoglucosaminidase
MNECEASKIPLLTLSDFLRNPAGYVPGESYRNSLRRLLGKEKRYIELQAVIDGSKGNPLDPSEAEELRELIRRTIMAFDGNEPSRRKLSSLLRAHFTKYAELGDRLVNQVQNRKLLSELEPVIAKLEKLARLGLICIELAVVNSDAKKEYESGYQKLRKKANRAAKEVRKYRTQVLGEIDFGLRRNKEAGPSTEVIDALSGLGLPLVYYESPIIEFYRWSVKAS